jgi:site-specific DNA-methyltransferase (adenine-specific)
MYLQTGIDTMQPSTPLLPAFAATPRTDTRALENRVLCMDALDMLRQLPDASIDLIATDPPYNTTACDFESDIALQDTLWREIWRVIKPNRAVVMTGAQPFTTLLIYRNLKYYRHSWVWEKTLATGYLNANRQPMKAHEDVIVFGNGGV